MLGCVAAVIETESPSQLRPAVIHRMWTSLTAGCTLGLSAVGNRAGIRDTPPSFLDSLPPAEGGPPSVSNVEKRLRPLGRPRNGGGNAWFRRLPISYAQGCDAVASNFHKSMSNVAAHSSAVSRRDRSSGPCAEAGRDLRAVRAPEARARIPAGARREAAVVAACDVTQGVGRGVKSRIDKAGRSAVGGVDARDEASPERCDGAGPADHGIGAVDAHVVSGLGVGIATDIGHPPVRQCDAASRRPGHVQPVLPRTAAGRSR